MKLRPAELAGQWYPATAAACDHLLDAVPPTTVLLPEQRFGAIVPHGGWSVAGAVAFEALRALAEATARAELVVVFGGHLGARDLPRVLIEGGFETPYGVVEIASEVAEDVSMAMASDLETPEEYWDDNAVEVSMPMVKKLWPEAKGLTVGVPPLPEASKLGAEVLERAWARGYREVVVIGSTDLTHYGRDYDFVPKGRGHRGHAWVKEENDPALIRELERLDAGKVSWVGPRARNACAPGAAAAALTAARKLGAKRGVTLRHTTSWEARGSLGEPESFIGYVGMVLGA